MYEQDATPGFRRTAWVVLWFIVVVAVLWALIWLVFFRHTSPKVSTLHGSNTGQSQSSGSSNNKNNNGTGGSAGSTAQNSNSSSQNSNSSSSSSSTTANNSATTGPTQLANTGAGNVLVPFAVAGVTGSTLYYVRLRRKLLR